MELPNNSTNPERASTRSAVRENLSARAAHKVATATTQQEIEERRIKLEKQKKNTERRKFLATKVNAPLYNTATVKAEADVVVVTKTARKPGFRNGLRSLELRIQAQQEDVDFWARKVASFDPAVPNRAYASSDASYQEAIRVLAKSVASKGSMLEMRAKYHSQHPGLRQPTRQDFPNGTQTLKTSTGAGPQQKLPDMPASMTRVIVSKSRPEVRSVLGASTPATPSLATLPLGLPIAITPNANSTTEVYMYPPPDNNCLLKSHECQQLQQTLLTVEGWSRGCRKHNANAKCLQHPLVCLCHPNGYQPRVIQVGNLSNRYGSSMKTTSEASSNSQPPSHFSLNVTRSAELQQGATLEGSSTNGIYLRRGDRFYMRVKRSGGSGLVLMPPQWQPPTTTTLSQNPTNYISTGSLQIESLDQDTSSISSLTPWRCTTSHLDASTINWAENWPRQDTRAPPLWTSTPNNTDQQQSNVNTETVWDPFCPPQFVSTALNAGQHTVGHVSETMNGQQPSHSQQQPQQSSSSCESMSQDFWPFPKQSDPPKHLSWWAILSWFQTPHGMLLKTFGKQYTVKPASVKPVSKREKAKRNAMLTFNINPDKTVMPAVTSILAGDVEGDGNIGNPSDPPPKELALLRPNVGFLTPHTMGSGMLGWKDRRRQQQGLEVAYDVYGHIIRFAEGQTRTMAQFQLNLKWAEDYYAKKDCSMFSEKELGDMKVTAAGMAMYVTPAELAVRQALKNETAVREAMKFHKFVKHGIAGHRGLFRAKAQWPMVNN